MQIKINNQRRLRPPNSLTCENWYTKKKTKRNTVQRSSNVQTDFQQATKFHDSPGKYIRITLRILAILKTTVLCIRFFMSCSPAHNRYTPLTVNISPYFAPQQVFLLLFLPFSTFLFFFFLTLSPYLHFWRCLYSIRISLQTSHAVIVLLARSRFLHSVQCGSAALLYQALEKRSM